MTDEFPKLNGTDYVELYVGNAKQAAHFYQTTFGFQPLAYAGLETGMKDHTSYVLQQEKIRLVLTAAMSPDSFVAEHQKKHGDGVRCVALWVDDATQAFRETVNRGAKPVLDPVREEDDHGFIIKSGIWLYNDTVHYFIERKNYHGPFLPGFQAWNPSYRPAPIGLKYVDHMVHNVGWGEMDPLADFYARTMGFTQLISFDDKDISTEYTALKSKVMTNKTGYVRYPINEPAKGLKRSQVEEYLDFYQGAGVQHIAMATDDIIHSVSELKKRGVEFLHIPGTYYDTVTERIGEIDEDLQTLKELGILVDRDEYGYLLQIFTKPVEDRPTLFMEIIQRKGARSFGKGNFKALFVSIEEEQKKRGTL